MYESIQSDPNVSSVLRHNLRKAPDFVKAVLGIVLATGGAGDKLDKAGKDPILTAWGWQFEYKYLETESGVEGLIEFIPLVIGMDQDMQMASVNVLAGLRFKNGFEFLVGPNLTLADSSDFDPEDPNEPPAEDASPFGFLAAIGYTFRSGQMNFPINFSVLRADDDIRIGITFGWNASQ